MNGLNGHCADGDADPRFRLSNIGDNIGRIQLDQTIQLEEELLVGIGAGTVGGPWEPGFLQLCSRGPRWALEGLESVQEILDGERMSCGVAKDVLQPVLLAKIHEIRPSLTGVASLQTEARTEQE